MKNPLIDFNLDGELQHHTKLFAEAMMMVSSIYGSSLSHEEFMDKAEEIFCTLLEEGECAEA